MDAYTTAGRRILLKQTRCEENFLIGLFCELFELLGELFCVLFWEPFRLFSELFELFWEPFASFWALLR